MGNTQSNLPTYYNADPTNDAYAHSLTGYVDLASEALGAKVVRASNERFGAASNLIKAQEPQLAQNTKCSAAKGEFDAWVTRRHNPETDWAVIRLGSIGSVAGFNIDTRGLDGEHASQVSIQGCLAPENSAVDNRGDIEDVNWEELLPAIEIAPNSKHTLALWTPTAAVNFVRITLHPDGGVARLRILGTVAVNPEAVGETDLASVNAGARVIMASDEKLGAKENLILPGRATADSPETLGWKTRRSRSDDHTDWAIVQLGEPGFLTRIELDTGLYDGDQPAAASVQACYTEMANPERDPQCFWYQIVARTELNGSKVHKIDVSLNDVPFSHIKLVVHPDGGVSRLRAYGQRVKEIEEEAAREEAEAAAEAALAAEIGLDSETPSAASENEEATDEAAEQAAEDQKQAKVVAEEVIVVEITESETAADETAADIVTAAFIEAEAISSAAESTTKSLIDVTVTEVPVVAETSGNNQETVIRSKKADRVDKADKQDVPSTPPRKKQNKSRKNSGSESEVPAKDQFSSRAGELIQSLTSPMPIRKRANTRSRVEEDTDEGSTNTVDSQPKRPRRKPKSRNQTAAN
ncbi:galactose-binding domain-like protein [Kickxella alabastrina]|uniref:galactose-binding domain-like protein n=1 Tax=Kickxella alabastrina TaxID=61397 RepID=UPI002220A12F|nr:galactose-binding domain-like protein [Kickxella alabastrina]KAI7834130.1 galactose-binding domain-like protein [Kickxella alabastrina]